MATKKPVFYSFHFDNDVFRVQQIRNIGALEDNTPVSPNEWEQVRRGQDTSIRKWIDDNMKYRRCVIVLIGAQTAQRPWVQYEIGKAWAEGKGLFGIYIHNLKCPRQGKSVQGANPFTQIRLTDGTSLGSRITCYDPSFFNPYSDIASNLETWVDRAINER